MSIKSTKTITRNVAIARMSYVITLLEEGLYDEAEASHFNGYDGSTELETEDYYIYYHNQN